jgi:putative transposase
LWEGRFKSTLVDTERYLLTLYRYIELNPVRASMVEHPAAYPWSSYQGNAGDRNITLLTPHPVYLALGNTKAERRSAYQGLFLSHLSDNTIQAIRDATNKAWALGDESFIEQVANTLSRRAKPLPQSGDRKQHYRDTGMLTIEGNILDPLWLVQRFVSWRYSKT